VAVEELTADLAVAADVARVAQQAASPDVTLLVNNAGITRVK
jgi:short-subunit dehydrogenase